MPISPHLRNVKSLLTLPLTLLVTVVTAQTPTPSAADSARAALPTQLQFKSAMSGYQPYAEQPVESWRAANDKVSQIGGWRAYAKEGRSAESTQETPATGAHPGHHGGAKP